MPQLTQVVTAEDLAQRRTTSRLDLTPYLDILTTVLSEGGVGGIVSLEPNESQRTVKRRLSVAARQQGFDLVWRKSLPNTLRFVLARPSELPPDARKRRPRADNQAEQIAVEAVMTPEVAEVTDTKVEQATEAAAPPAPRRGRRTARSAAQG